MSQTKPADVKFSIFHNATQILLPVLTITGFVLTSAKQPAYGLAFNLSAQVFWIYSGWKAWKVAGQIGIFITSVIICLVLIAGVINYWIL